MGMTMQPEDIRRSMFFEYGGKQYFAVDKVEPFEDTELWQTEDTELWHLPVINEDGNYQIVFMSKDDTVENID